MKKLIFFISFIFSVVCFASPPPLIDFDDGSSIIQVTPDQVTSAINFEAPEVAFSYIGNSDQLPEVYQYAEELRAFSLPAVPVRKYRSMINYKPPSINIAKCGFKINYQNSNYGYPFTGDNC